MKNRKNFFIIILVIIVIALILIFGIKNNAKKSGQLETQNKILNSIEEENTLSLNETTSSVKEEELANFSTPLAGDENRLENIKISCDTINGTILKNGESFSFNDIIGEPTPEKGYKEADVLIETTVTKDYGGGNCQVSTTLYNACLETPGIEITERHPHKKNVAYVEEGKDASVSYGVLDLKFTNNTGSDIKIYMNSENNQVTSSIVKISKNS